MLLYTLKIFWAALQKTSEHYVKKELRTNIEIKIKRTMYESGGNEQKINRKSIVIMTISDNAFRRCE